MPDIDTAENHPTTRCADRAPDCVCATTATIAGGIAEAVMAGEVNIADRLLPLAVWDRMRLCFRGPINFTTLAEGFRVAGLMIGARARASVRTPDGAALSAAEAALALAEDALDARAGAEPPDAFATLGSVAETIRAGLARRHAAERTAPEAQAPYDAGPATA